MKRPVLLSACAAVIAAGIAIAPLGLAAAQGPGDGRGPSFGVGPVTIGSPLVCSTTDYAAVAGTALGLSAAEVRVGLVSGKTLEELAKEKGVDAAGVHAALDNAYKADVEQATQEGIFTPTHDVVIAEAGDPSTIVPALPAVPPVPGIPMTIEFSGINGGSGMVSPLNEVRPHVVAAEAMDMNCADLVKATQNSGKSIVQVAADSNIQVQTLVDALVNAYQKAASQDVAEGLITEAQAAARNRNLVERVTRLISQPGGAFAFGGTFAIEIGHVERIGSGIKIERTEKPIVEATTAP